jgi:BirA family biotin operon repressor/biotin-[acetyl-CoA-carboxylase] ligase
MTPVNKDSLDANTAASLLAMLEYPCRLVLLETIGSTNDELLRRLHDHSSCCPGSAALPPLVVISGRQTSGRGRLGRDWSSPPGGISMSVLLSDGPASANSSVFFALSPLVALAVRDALQGFTPQPIQIKWPNDVLSAQGKLAGILIERRTTSPDAAKQAGLVAVIAGIGINVLRPGTSSAGFDNAAYLGELRGKHQKQATPIAVAAATLNSLFDRYRHWQEAGYDFAPFAADYQKHQAQLGEQVWVRNAMGKLIASGEVQGIDAAGRLMLCGEQGEVPVTAGEVTLRK